MISNFSIAFQRGRSSIVEVQSSTDESDLEIDIEEVSDSNDAESNPSPKKRKLSPAGKKSRRQDENPRPRKGSRTLLIAVYV